MATGTLSRTILSNCFVAEFNIDGVVYEFKAEMDPGIQSFKSTTAVLSYRKLTQLTCTRVFRGKIGITAASITLDNRLGVTITAKLAADVDPATTIVGAGHWTQYRQDHDGTPVGHCVDERGSWGRCDCVDPGAVRKSLSIFPPVWRNHNSEEEFWKTCKTVAETADISGI